MAGDRQGPRPEKQVAENDIRPPSVHPEGPDVADSVLDLSPAPSPRAFSPAALGGAAPRGRGYPAARTAMLLALQQTHGNQAVQRFLQRSPAAAAPAAGQAGEDLDTQIHGAGGGQALEPQVQTRLEQGLGADLSGVRLHTDGQADRLARTVNAVAFTSSSDIFFRSGAYQPSSTDGMRLLAHEATHAVQQAAGPVAGTPSPSGGVISDPGDSFERAAEQAAESAAGSRPLSAPDASDGALGVALTLQRLPDGLTIQRDDGDTATATAESPPSPKPPSPTPSAP